MTEAITLEDAKRAVDEIEHYANTHNINTAHYDSITTHLKRIRDILGNLKPIEKLERR